MPNLPALTLGHTACSRAFWSLFAAETFRDSLRWGTDHLRTSTLRAFGYARGGA